MAKTSAVTVKVKLLSADAKMPTKARAGDVAFDLYSAAELNLEPGEHGAVPTGIAVEVPDGYEGQVRPRSGLAAEHGVTVLNTPGTIDSGYRGEVKTIMINLGSKSFHITKGMRISQLAIRPVPDVTLVESDNLSGTERGGRGLGSTGLS